MATNPVVPVNDPEIDRKIEAARKRLVDLQHQQAAERFVANNPSYEANPENQRVMQEYLRSNDFEPTQEGLENAYRVLKTRGLIDVPTGVEDKPTTEKGPYQLELERRIVQAQEALERERQIPLIHPANGFILQQAASQSFQQFQTGLQQAGQVPSLADIPSTPVTPQETLKAGLKAVVIPTGRRVKNVAID